MKNIRRGNDIRFRWQIRRGEDVESFDGKDISVVLRDQFGNSCDVEWSIADGGIISGVSRGKTQSKLGVYTLTLVENDGANDMATVDKISAWRLVAVQDASLVDDEATNDCGNICVEVIELESEIGLGSLPMSIDTELNPDSDNAIANSAVTKGINAVGEMTEEELQEVVNNSSAYYPQKAKKKKQQIVIGRSISPLSCNDKTKEVWYVVNKEIIFRIRREWGIRNENEFVQKVSIFIDGIRCEPFPLTQMADASGIHDCFSMLNPNFRLYMLRVDSYTFVDGKVRINLTSKNCSQTITGESSHHRLVMGKRIYDHKIPVSVIKERLCNVNRGNWSNFKVPTPWELRRVEEVHKKGNNIGISRHNLKKGSRIYSQAGYDKSRCFRSGLYKVRYVKGSFKGQWTYFYMSLVFQNSNPTKIETIKDIIIRERE